MEISHQELIEKIYTYFNERDIPKVLSFMSEDVLWPNGWEGGYVKGKEEIKNYWTRQWQEVDPKVDPVAFTRDGDGRVIIDVHQVVKDKSGNVLTDTIVKHIYVIEHDLIKSMEIEET